MKRAQEDSDLGLSVLLSLEMSSGAPRNLANEILVELLKSGEITTDAVREKILGLPAAKQEHLLISQFPWLAEICGGLDSEVRGNLYSAGLTNALQPYAGRFTHAFTYWQDDPDWVTEPEDKELGKGDCSVFEIGDDVKEGEDSRPPDSAPVSERLSWLEKEIQRKTRHLNTLVTRLELEKILLAFFLGSVPSGEVVRHVELEAFERSMRQGGMESGWRRRVLDKMMQAIRDGDAGAIRHMLSKYSWLRGKLLKFLLKRFHLIGAILAAVDLAPMIHDLLSARSCRSRLDELEKLRWKWMVEAGILVQPGGAAQLGPYVNPGSLGIPPGTPCQHSVTYIFTWENEAGDEFEEVLAGPRPLKKPGDDEEGLPPGALTDHQALPSPTIPEGFARGYIVYEFITRCPGRDPIVSRILAVAVTKPTPVLGPF